MTTTTSSTNSTPTIEDGSEWNKITGDFRGNWIETQGASWLGVVGVNPDDQIWPTAGTYDVSAYSYFEFENVGANAFYVETSNDGTNWSRVWLKDSGVANPDANRVAASTAGNNTSKYYYEGKALYLRVKQSGAGAANARGRLAVR